MKKSTIQISGILLIAFVLIGISPLQAQQQKEEAVTDLIKRVLPKAYQSFTVSFIPQEKGKDVFELTFKNGKIQLSGSNGVSIASALNYYLKNYCHSDISWNGTNISIPNPLPEISGKVHQQTPYNYRYYLNYCTFNYSMSWWDWDRWQWEIDFMALNGVNMPLALTGQNAIWKRVYKQLGFTDEQLHSFFSGPAYFNWFWMGNLDGWGGPLPDSWMEQHEALQKKILERERSLGMTPVLPAFTGHVPPAFKDKFPNAKLKKTNWNGDFGDVYILDPGDEMFTVIGSSFLKELIKSFGTDHLYSADTFNENTPPTNDSSFLDGVSKKVYQSMAAVDPKAIWIMQGWMFSYSAKFWQPTQIKALLNAVPDKKLIVLDLYSESKPVWNKTDAYYGKPWIWCMLHNFGGNISLFGRMSHVAADPANALNDPKGGNMIGIGLTPEAIEQNPVMYALMLDNTWRNQPIDLPNWLKEYAWRRYGRQNEDINKAWSIMERTVYNGGLTSGGPESIISGRPTLNKATRWTATKLHYEAADLIPAWELFIKNANELAASDGFRYDLIDITRQVLANYADTLQQQFAAACKAGDKAAFNKYAGNFIMLIDDMDKLLGTRKDFLLGKWLNEARACGNTTEEKDLYERNARNLITLWGDKNSKLHEYSCRQWAGLLNGFYKPRWQKFFAYVNDCMDKQQKIDEKAFEADIVNWEWSWVNGHEQYTDKPANNEVKTAQALYSKYSTTLNKIYGLK